MGLIFTAVAVSLNAFLLPRIYPLGVSLHNILLFKTVFGTAVGTLATWLAVHRVLDEAE